MSKRPDIQADHHVLTVVSWTMLIVGGLQIWTILPLLNGGPDALAVPVGLAALLVTVGVMWWTGHKLTNKQDGGPRLAFWGRAIRTMGTINILVALILIALPRIP
jgi:hypothetical protein